MEEENSVFGVNAKDSDNFDLEEKFDFYHKNKETAEKDIDEAAKDLTDFFDSVSQDVPELSEEEINRNIENILEITHPAQKQSEPTKTVKNKKVKLKVLFLVALLSIVSFSCLCVVGSKHDISIENGFVTFAKDTIKIVFFGEDKEEHISVDTLLIDLEAHEFKDVLFPEEFIVNTDEYQVSIPDYLDEDIRQVTFSIHKDKTIYRFGIYDFNPLQQTCDYVGMDNAQTVIIDDICIYIFEFDDGDSAAEFVYDDFHYFIKADIPCSEMVRIVETIK